MSSIINHYFTVTGESRTGEEYTMTFSASDEHIADMFFRGWRDHSDWYVTYHQATVFDNGKTHYDELCLLEDLTS